jgi:hypothetical protein
MFQRDYMMRMIEQFNQTLGVLVGLKQNREPTQALLHIDELLKRLLGLNSKLVNGLSDRALLDLLRQGRDGGSDKILIVANLLKEEGDFHLMLGDSTSAYHRQCKALALYMAAAADEADRDYIDYTTEIQTLLEALRPYTLPLPIRLELWQYQMSHRQYAEAENELFQLIEEGHGNEQLLTEAITQYAKLLELDDAQLQAGGLSLEEVEETIDQLREQQKGLPLV